MSYADGEALWLTRLRAMTQFNSNNSSRGKWGILNSGHSNQYAILKPGEHEREMLGFTTRVNHWQTIIELWQRYKDDGTVSTDLQALVDAVLTEMDKYRLIGDATGSVQDAQIVQVREMQQTPVDSPDWLYVELVGAWNEEETISFAE